MVLVLQAGLKKRVVTPVSPSKGAIGEGDVGGGAIITARRTRGGSRRVKA